MNIFPAFFLIGRDAVYTQGTQRIETIHQQIGRFETALGHDRFHRIQFHLGRFTTHSYTKVVTYYFIVNLIHHFGNNRIDLTRHNGRTGLHGRQIDFAQPATRAGCQKAQVIAYLIHFYSYTAHSRRVTYQTRSVGSSSYQIIGQTDIQSGNLPESRYAFACIFRLGGDSGSDGSSSHIDGQEVLSSKVQVLDFILKDTGKTIERLSERHRHRIFQLGAPHLDHMCKLFALSSESIDHLLKMFHQFEVRIIHTDMNSGRISVIGRLRTVNMIIGRTILIFPTFMSHQLECAVGYNLVGIHVGGSSGSTLDHVYRELVMMLPFQNFFTCTKNGICLLFGQQSKFKVSHSGSHLGNGQCINK